MDVSPTPVEHSKNQRENSPMSAADDVAEMQTLAGFIADKLSASTKNKDRTNALHASLNPDLRRGKELISWNRCFEFLTGRARLVQSWEKDLAREKRKAIEATERDRRNREHIEWLRFVHQQAAADGADMDRADFAALERVLSRVGALDSAVGNPGEA
jgi:hypothetical protein